MSDFYTEARSAALDLVSEFGRDITVSQISTVDKVPGKPHRGQEDAPVNSVTAKGVFVNPGDAAELGLKTTKQDLVDRLSQVAIVAADGVNDLREFTNVVDDNQTFTIEEVQELKPGSVSLLYYLFMVD